MDPNAETEMFVFRIARMMLSMVTAVFFWMISVVMIYCCSVYIVDKYNGIAW